MKRLQFILAGGIFLYSLSAFPEDLSGCLVSDGKKLITDATCLCSKKKECASFEKINFKSDFFNGRDEKNKALFPEKLKDSYKEADNLFNKVIELKAAGKGHSDEIKEVYLKLDKTNNSIRKQLIKAQPAFMERAKKNYLEKLNARQLQAENIENHLKSFMSGSNSKFVASNGSSSSSSGEINNPAPVARAVRAVKKAVAAQVNNSEASTLSSVDGAKKEEVSSSEKEFILKHMDNKWYEVNQDDSLFDIVSKTYKKRAYKTLLTP